jgi:hypothetical protein
MNFEQYLLLSQLIDCLDVRNVVGHLMEAIDLRIWSLGKMKIPQEMIEFQLYRFYRQQSELRLRVTTALYSYSVLYDHASREGFSVTTEYKRPLDQCSLTISCDVCCHDRGDIDWSIPGQEGSIYCTNCWHDTPLRFGWESPRKMYNVIFVNREMDFNGSTIVIK